MQLEADIQEQTIPAYHLITELLEQASIIESPFYRPALGIKDYIKGLNCPKYDNLKVIEMNILYFCVLNQTDEFKLEDIHDFTNKTFSLRTLQVKGQSLIEQSIILKLHRKKYRFININKVVREL
ncbi:hypothetical protein [Macrococcus hajekii]|nr:hypothetical protein [Macrococcus hajekii]